MKKRILYSVVLFSLLTVLLGIQLIQPAEEVRADAKSLYLIGAINANPSPVQAWGIQADGSLVHQFTEGVAARAGGAVGIALEPASQTLFITYEFTNIIQLVDARTMLEIGTTAAPGASNLAGIVADEGKSLIYTVDRNTGKLYSYSWNAATKTLTLQAGFPKTLPNLTQAFGVALDELNGRLFIADGYNNQVEYYNTTTWGHLATLNVGHRAIGIAVDSANGFVYTSAGWVGNAGLWKWDLATGMQTYTANSNLGVMGIAVDQNSHLVYATTGYSGDDLRVFNPDLSLRHTYSLPRTYTDSSDGRTYTFTPSPTGIVIPGRAVSYNPLNLSKSDGLDAGQTVPPGGNINYTLSFQNGNPNPVTGVVLTDTLPPQTTFVSTSDGGSLSGSTVTWNIGTIASAASRSVSLVVQVKSDTPGGTTITNRSSIDSDQTGPAYATEDTLIGVTNQPPTANAGGPYTVPEGGSVQLNGSGTDPDNGPLTFSWDLDNDGTFETPGQNPTFSAAGRDGPSSQTVVLKVCDDDNACATASAVVNIPNVAPSATVAPITPIGEGGSSFISLIAPVEPSPADFGAGLRYSFACDGQDSSLATTYAAASPTNSALCPFPDNGSFPVKARIFDKDNGFSTYQGVAVVNNTPPSVNAGPDATNISGQTHQVNAGFGDPGKLDTHTATINWGDGSPVQTGMVNEANGSGTVTGSHVYFLPGSYTITVTVTDKDGGVGSDSLVKTVKRLPVTINIKPGSDPNSINLKALVPVAILTTPSFDATQVNVATVRFGPLSVLQGGGGGTEVHNQGHIEDSKELDETTQDGDLDMVLHFDASVSGLTETTTVAYVWGVTNGGVYFEGSDAVRIPPGNNKTDPGTGTGKGPK